MTILILWVTLLCLRERVLCKRPDVSFIEIKKIYFLFIKINMSRANSIWLTFLSKMNIYKCTYIGDEWGILCCVIHIPFTAFSLSYKYIYFCSLFIWLNFAVNARYNADILNCFAPEFKNTGNSRRWTPKEIFILLWLARGTSIEFVWTISFCQNLKIIKKIGLQIYGIAAEFIIILMQ